MNLNLYRIELDDSEHCMRSPRIYYEYGEDESDALQRVFEREEYHISIRKINKCDQAELLEAAASMR